MWMALTVTSEDLGVFMKFIHHFDSKFYVVFLNQGNNNLGFPEKILAARIWIQFYNERFSAMSPPSETNTSELNVENVVENSRKFDRHTTAEQVVIDAIDDGHDLSNRVFIVTVS